MIIRAKLPSGITDTLYVDAVTEEGYDNAASITSHPVEEGSNVSDNIRTEPEKLNLSVTVTNTPLYSSTPFEGIPLAEDAYRKLQQWQVKGALLTVPVTMGIRTSMAIAHLGAMRDAKTGGPPGRTGGVKIRLQLQEVRVVQNRLVAVSTSKDKRMASKVATGAQLTAPADPEPTDLAIGFGQQLGIAK